MLRMCVILAHSRTKTKQYLVVPVPFQSTEANKSFLSSCIFVIKLNGRSIDVLGEIETAENRHGEIERRERRRQYTIILPTFALSSKAYAKTQQKHTITVIRKHPTAKYGSVWWQRTRSMIYAITDHTHTLTHTQFSFVFNRKNK